MVPVVYDGFTLVPLAIEVRVDVFYPRVIAQWLSVRGRACTVVYELVRCNIVSAVGVRVQDNCLSCIPRGVRAGFIILDSWIMRRRALACRVH